MSPQDYAVTQISDSNQPLVICTERASRSSDTKTLLHTADNGIYLGKKMKIYFNTFRFVTSMYQKLSFISFFVLLF